MFYVFYVNDDKYEKDFDLKEFPTKDEVEGFINKHPNYHYTVIEGREIGVKTVTTITRLELGA